MQYYSCSSPYNLSTTNVVCDAVITEQTSPTTDTNNYYITCNQQFEKSYTFVKCLGTATTGKYSDLSANENLFALDSYTEASGAFKNPVNLSNVQIQLINSGSGNQNPQDYQLSGELMQVVFTSTMYIFAFGVLLGGIAGLIRKTAHK